MHRPLVTVTRRLVPDAVELLATTCELRVHDDESPMLRAALLDAVAGCDGVVSTLADVIDDELLDAAGPRLRIVANHAVGYHNVDVAACDARNITVTNTPDVLTDATADLAWALLLAAARRVGEGERWIRGGTPWDWAPTFLLGQELRGATLGVIGLGRIGKAVADRAVGFGMVVAYHNRRPVPGESAHYCSLEELLRDSDVVCVCCPLSGETRGLIDAAALRRMKPEAVLVSVAAGGIVDEAALAEALARGEIFAAGLDCFAEEPRVHPLLLNHGRVVLTPHIGSATLHTRREMGLLAARNATSVLSGYDPLTPVGSGAPRR